MVSFKYEFFRAITVLLFIVTSQIAYAADVSGQVAVSGLTLTKQTRISSTVFEYTYKVGFTNSGGALTGVSATVASLSPKTKIIDSNVNIGDLGANASVTPADTITIRQDRTVALSKTSLQWSFAGTSTGIPGVSVDGVLLQGAPDSPAVDALVFRVGETPTPESIVNNLITTRLTALIKIEATVAQVNAALTMVGGRITAMTSDTGLIDIGVPPVADVAAANVLAQRLLDTGIFFLVEPVFAVDLESKLPGNITNPLRTSGSETKGDSYLDEIRAPAAWNLRKWLLDKPGSMIEVNVPDFFYNTKHRDLNISLKGPIGDAIGNGNHGWHVAGTIGANHADNQDATGIHPAPERLRIKGISIATDTFLNIINKIKNELITSEKFILNTSFGYGDSKYVVKNLSPPSLQVKVILAINWRAAMAPLQNKFLHVAAAGNDHQVLRDFESKYASPWNMAASKDNLCDLVSGSAKVECNIEFDRAITRKDKPPIKNVLIVGSKKGGYKDEYSVFSNPGEDISAVGENVLNLCVQKNIFPLEDDGCPGPNSVVKMEGTSMATPQVAGVAATLWSIKPGLTVYELIDIIKGSPLPVSDGVSFDVKLLDVYNSILAIDEVVVKDVNSVRLHLLDLTGDDEFNLIDFREFIDNFAFRVNFGQTGVVDYSRYDLNGDGYTGGFAAAPFNLDADLKDHAAIYNPYLTQDLGGGKSVVYNEYAVTDLDILCYYAYSPLFPAADRTGIQDIFDKVNKIYGTQLSCRGLEILVKSNDPGGPFSRNFLTFDSKISINNSGKVAFVGRNSLDDSAGYVISDPSLATRITFEGSSSTRRFGGAGITNGDIPEAVFRETVPGAPPTSLIRKWRSQTDATMIGRSSGVIGGMCLTGPRAGQVCLLNSDCPDYIPFTTGQCSLAPSAPFDSATFWLDINDNGVVAFFGLVDGSTKSAIFAGKDEVNLKRLIDFPAFTSPALRPQIAINRNSNVDEVVFLDNSISTSQTVNVVQNPSKTKETVASTPEFKFKTDRPGISADGEFVAFAAENGGQNGLFLFRRGILPAHWKVVNTDGDKDTTQGVFTAFTSASRYAVASTVIKDDSRIVTILFAGTRSYTPAGELSSVTREGIYRVVVKVDKFNKFEVLSPPTVIVEKGVVLALNSKTVSNFDLWDPLSDNSQFVAFWVSFTDGTQAILRGRP